MWDFYLAASESAFRWQGMMVFQIQLAHKQDAVPLTRDYIMQEEERLLKIDADPNLSMIQMKPVDINLKAKTVAQTLQFPAIIGTHLIGAPLIGMQNRHQVRGFIAVYSATVMELQIYASAVAEHWK